jgi:hypothetical protein
MLHRKTNIFMFKLLKHRITWLPQLFAESALFRPSTHKADLTVTQTRELSRGIPLIYIYIRRGQEVINQLTNTGWGPE